MRRRFVTLLAAGAATLLITAPAWAWPNWFQGEPTLLTPGGATGYYIWHDADGLSLRTTSHTGENHFSGRLTTDGAFRGVTLARPETGDGLAMVGPDHLRFSFHTHQHLDGIDFHIEGGSWVRFDLELNGSPIGPRRIFVGRFNQHPGDNTFTIWR